VTLKEIVLGITALAVLAALPGRASAGWFLDVYAGYAVFESQAITFGSDRLKNVEYESSPVFGGRAGYFFDELGFLGIALDASYFRQDIDTQVVTSTARGRLSLANTDLSLTAIGLDVIVRVPLYRSPERPLGLLQPYVTVGPTLFFVNADDTSNFGPPNDQSPHRTSGGFKVGTGLAWQFHRALAVFAEYRFLYTTTELQFRSSTPGVNTPVNVDTYTNQVVGGISVRF
jgi:opacity protein-like surface antigen